jgi:GNAT superfamily N-acetyltransferase
MPFKNYSIAEIRFRKYKGSDFNEFKKMVYSFYREDSYGHPMNVHKIKNTLMELTPRSNRGAIFLFQFDDKTAGYAIVISYWSNEYGGNILFIDELYVKPEWRKKGIAGAWLEYLSAMDPGRIKALQLEVTPANSRAFNFYLKHNFQLNSRKSLIKIL